MKPKFTYLYIAFIVSLAILVILSFLFYKRSDSHIRYSDEVEKSFAVMFRLKDLEEKMMELESHSRGFMLTGDSSFLEFFTNERDSVVKRLDDLQELLSDNSYQTTRFLLMKSTIAGQINIFQMNIDRVGLGQVKDRLVSIQRGKKLMDTFQMEARQIEQAELKQRNDLLETKEYFENFYPNYFNTISIWAGIITLVSFYFINREVRMRARYQTELEKKLQELNRSNYELRQFAYIASHDLQEPLRKIRMFSDKLVYKHQDEINSESKAVIDRIEASAKRMQELIQDMINFTNLVSREGLTNEVDLNDLITKVLADFIEQSHERHAVITWDTLPVIKGNAEQLILLFRSLMDNAFKFAKPGESPEIRITYKLTEGSAEDPHLKNGPCHKIVMEDKGIGFNNEFAEKIFMIFQRLHTQQSGYRGKGIGLAIAQRIVANHNGVILARGIVDDGATFIMYFPAE